MRETILVVDDEVTMLRTVRRVLRDVYDVVIASNADEALAAARAHEPALAIVDIRMPHTNGFDVVGLLREQQKRLEVIFMTGAVHELDAQLIRAIRERAFYFIQKPFDREVLRTLVARCLELRRLAAENAAHTARLERQLAAARAFQRTLLPAPTTSRGPLAACAHYTPCEAVGGDLFDYHFADDGSLSFVVADVSGHGASAAMLTCIVKSGFHAAIQARGGPGEVIRAVADGLRPFDPARFVTLFTGRLAPAGQLEYVNAGHPPPYVCPASGAAPRALAATGAMASPAFPDLEWDVGRVTLDVGDELVAFTDGATEARDSNGEFFGEERFAAIIGDTDARGPARLERLLDALTSFRGGRPADDDCTILLVSHSRA